MTSDKRDFGLEHITNIDGLAASMEERINRVCHLNDQLRTRGIGGIIQMTDGIAGLDLSTINEVFGAIAAFDSFTPENDPHGEHDCAILTVAGVEVMWKIDCFDRSRRFLSPDPADSRVTVRVLTVMRADEY